MMKRLGMVVLPTILFAVFTAGCVEQGGREGGRLPDPPGPPGIHGISGYYYALFSNGEFSIELFADGTYELIKEPPALYSSPGGIRGRYSVRGNKVVTEDDEYREFTIGDNMLIDSRNRVWLGAEGRFKEKYTGMLGAHGATLVLNHSPDVFVLEQGGPKGSSETVWGTFLDGGDSIVLKMPDGTKWAFKKSGGDLIDQYETRWERE